MAKKQKEEEENELEATFCGIGKIPKGKARATPEFCASKKQVRYYGIEAVDPEVLNEVKKPNLIKEQLKYRKLLDDAKIMGNKFKTMSIILDNPDDYKKSTVKRTNKEWNELFDRKDKLVKKIKSQREKVRQLEADEEKRKAAEIEAAEAPKKPKKAKKTKKEAAKAPKKSKKSSGSKVTKKAPKKAPKKKAVEYIPEPVQGKRVPRKK